MANNVTIGPNILVCRTAETFINAGFTSDNMEIIYKVGSPLTSWKPTRVINGVIGFEAGHGYYLVAKAAMDLTAFTIPPTDAPVITQLATPTGFDATASSSSVIGLDCDVVTNATSYKFERATNSGFTTGLLTVYEGTNNFATASSLTADTTYYFRVKAIAGGYTDSDYATDSAATEDDALPLAPTPAGMTAVPSGTTSMTVDWSPGVGTEFGTIYVLDRATDAGFTTGLSLAIYSGTASGYGDSGLTAATTYYYRVRATFAGYADSLYATANGTTSAATQAPTPTGFTATPTTNFNANSLILAWTTAASTLYDIDIARDAGFTDIERSLTDQASGSTQNFFAPDTLFYLRIKAKKAGLTDSLYATTSATSGSMYDVLLGDTTPVTEQGILFTASNYTAAIEFIWTREAVQTGTPLVMTIQESGTTKLTVSYAPAYAGKTFIYYETDGTAHTDTFSATTKNYI